MNILWRIEKSENNRQYITVYFISGEIQANATAKNYWEAKPEKAKRLRKTSDSNHVSQKQIKCESAKWNCC